MFLVFLVAQNPKNTIPSSPVVGRVEREVFLVFLAAENLKKNVVFFAAQNHKNTIPYSTG